MQVQTEETVEGTEGVTVESAADEITEEVTPEAEETETPQETDESPQVSTEEVKFANNDEYEKSIEKKVYSEVQSRTHSLQSQLNERKKEVVELNRKLSQREIDKEIAILYDDDAETDEANAKTLEAARKSFATKLLDYKENGVRIEGLAKAINEVESNIPEGIAEEYGLNESDPVDKVKNFYQLFDETRELYSENKQKETELGLREKLISYRIDGGSEFTKWLDTEVEKLAKLSPDAQTISLEQIRKENKITPRDKPASPPSQETDGINLKDVGSRELIARGLRKMKK